MLRTTLMLICGLGLMLPMAGCGGDSGTPAAEAPRSRPAPKRDTGPVEPVVDEEPTEVVARYSYNSIGKRDPFRSFIAREVVVIGEGGPLGPLQMHEIDSYQLRGIVWNIQAPRALVEDPKQIGHVVELGTLIGKNWGKVTQIKPQELIITEEYRDPIENELIINEVTMRLPDLAELEKNR
jgi:type IV pilus assembly protein PilP